MCKYYKEYVSQTDWLFILNSPFGESGERNNSIKQPKFSVLRFPGTPRLCSNMLENAFSGRQKIKSLTIFSQIKTNRPFISKNKPQTPNLAPILAKTVKDDKTNLTMRLLYVILPQTRYKFQLTYKKKRCCYEKNSIISDVLFYLYVICN